MQAVTPMLWRYLVLFTGMFALDGIVTRTMPEPSQPTLYDWVKGIIITLLILTGVMFVVWGIRIIIKNW